MIFSKFVFHKTLTTNNFFPSIFCHSNQFFFHEKHLTEPIFFAIMLSIHYPNEGRITQPDSAITSLLHPYDNQEAHRGHPENWEEKADPRE